MLRTNSARGGAGIIVLTVLAFVAVWALIWLGLTRGTGGPRQSYVWMKASPSGEVWVEFNGSRMRISPTCAGLAQAKWIEATGTGWGMAEFPPAEAMIAPAGWERQWDSSELQMDIDWSGCSAVWLFTKSDPSGSRWDLHVSRRLVDGDTPETAPINEIPALSEPGLTIDASPKSEGDESRIEIEVAVATAGEEWGGLSLAKDGTPVPIRVRVLDEAGEVVSDKSGPIEDFGHT